MIDNRKPRREDWNKLVTVQLTVAEAWHLRSASDSQARRRRRDLERNHFVPEPGRANANEVQAELLESSSKKLMKAIFPNDQSAR